MRPHVDPPDRALNGVLFVDESKSRGYFLAVVAIQPGALSRTRKNSTGCVGRANAVSTSLGRVSPRGGSSPARSRGSR